MSAGQTTAVAPRIQLPRSERAALEKWAVVACDQFTSEPQYWERLDALVGSERSTLRLIYPEVYLEDRREERIAAINAAMREYLEQGVFEALPQGLILVERESPFAGRRLGLVLAVDLEDYSYLPGERALIRATEGTVLSRIPPRMQIREHAPIELPHIMLLMDDRQRSVIEPLYAQRASLKKLYDFELNMGGGHLRGYFVCDWQPVLARLEALLEPSLLQEKYGTTERILFAVGDGNHSLATAKACWEKLKPSLNAKQRECHPARFALCEVVNILDEGICFEPIHRAIFDVDGERLFDRLSRAMQGCAAETVCLVGDRECRMPIPADTAQAYGMLQAFLDGYCKECGGRVDYIHGESSLREICGRTGCVGLLMPALGKEDLFGYVLRHGPLPRKTFSMGEAVEKRYYLEAKAIQNLE